GQAMLQASVEVLRAAQTFRASAGDVRAETALRERLHDSVARWSETLLAASAASDEAAAPELEAAMVDIDQLTDAIVAHNSTAARRNEDEAEIIHQNQL